MYAIFEDGSHQYRVSEGDRVTLDLRAGEPKDQVVFDKVLLVAGDDGANIGSPLVAGARVEATILRSFKDKKIIIQKFRRRKNHRRKRGHRQQFTTVQVTRIAVS